MDIFGVLSLIGGLAIFLYGMDLLGEGLTGASGGKLEKILEKLTSNPLKAVLLGAGVTAVIQSSSATTVMVVGFVNSGIMKLSQAVGVIMGANIGTTITSWILSLTGIESSNIFISLLKPTSFSPVLAAVGIVFLMFLKKDSLKNPGKIMIGFALLMYGMDAMSSSVAPLAEVPQFASILTAFSNPVLILLSSSTTYMYAIFIFPSVLIRLIVSVYKLYGYTTTENCVFPAVCIFPYKPYNPLQTADYLYSLFRQDIHVHRIPTGHSE